MMKLINHDMTDLSLEAYILLADMIYLCQAIQVIDCRMADALDRIKAKDTFFQAKRRYVNEAVKCAQRLYTLIDAITETAMGSIFDRAKERGNVRWASGVIQETTDLLTCATLIILSRLEGSENVGANMLKPLYNFKPSDRDLDLDSILDFFHYNKLLYNK